MWSRRNFAPVLFLSINGQDASDLLRRTTSFTHKGSTKKMAETTWVMNNFDRKLLSDPRTFPNTRWQFRFGFFNDLSPIITGIIREVKPTYADSCTVTFSLFDVSSLVSQGSGARNWGRIPSSEIAKKIAKANDMEAVVDDSRDIPAKSFIQPANINDLQYLRDLAADIDFEVFVDETPPRLYYRKKPYDQQPQNVLTYFDDHSEFSYVKSFSPKVKSMGPPNTGVSKANSGKGAAGKKASSSQGKDSALAGYLSLDGDTGKGTRVPAKTTIDVGDAAAALAVGAAAGAAGGVVGTAILAAKPVSRSRELVSKMAPSGANVAGLAAAARSQLLDQANEANSDHPLTPSIIWGKLYEWRGLDQQLNGKWYADEVTYTINATSSGTQVTWKRNAKGTGKDKNKKQNKKDAADSNKPGKTTIVIDGDSGAQRKAVTLASASGR